MVELSATDYYILGVLNLGFIGLAFLGNIRALPFRVIKRHPQNPDCWAPTVRVSIKLALFVAVDLSVAICWLAYRQEGGFLVVILASAVLVVVRDYLEMRRVLRLIRERIDRE